LEIGTTLRATRAAKIGAHTGQFTRIFHVFPVLKMFKWYNVVRDSAWFRRRFRRSSKKDDDDDDEEDDLIDGKAWQILRAPGRKLRASLYTCSCLSLQADIARHVLGCRLTQLTRIRNALDYVVNMNCQALIDGGGDGGWKKGGERGSGGGGGGGGDGGGGGGGRKSTVGGGGGSKGGKGGDNNSSTSRIARNLQDSISQNVAVIVIVTILMAPLLSHEVGRCRLTLSNPR
jgi:hypothetical protein